MTDAVRCGPIDALAGELQAASSSALRLQAAEYRTVINLRGQPADATFTADIEKTLGVELPVDANRWNGDDAHAAIWMGPDEWLVVTTGSDAATMEETIRVFRPDDPWLSVVDVSHNYACLRLSGPRSRALLAKGCSLDLHPRVFGRGDCAQSILAKTRVMLRAMEDGSSIELWVRNSFARYLVRWVLDAAAEFRVSD